MWVTDDELTALLRAYGTFHTRAGTFGEKAAARMRDGDAGTAAMFASFAASDARISEALRALYSRALHAPSAQVA